MEPERLTITRKADQMRVVLSQSVFPDEAAGKIVRDGIHVADYYAGGFLHRNVFFWLGKRSYPTEDMAERSVMCLAQMNQHLEVGVVAEFANWYLSQKVFTLSGFNQKWLESKIDFAWHGMDSAFWIKRKYDWKAILSLDDKCKIAQSNGAFLKKQQTLMDVHDAIFTLRENGEFLCSAFIAEEAKISRSSAAKYMHIYEDEILEYNMALFGTNSYKEHEKQGNVSAIKDVVEKYGVTNKRKIARMTNMHYNTVGNLWEEAFKN